MDKGILDPFKGTIVDIATKQVLGALITRAPFLSFGPLGFIASFVIQKIISIALDKTILGVNLYIIRLEADGNVDQLRELLHKHNDAQTKEKKDAIELEIIEQSKHLINLYDAGRL